MSQPGTDETPAVNLKITDLPVEVCCPTSSRASGRKERNGKHIGGVRSRCCDTDGELKPGIEKIPGGALGPESISRLIKQKADSSTGTMSRAGNGLQQKPEHRPTLLLPHCGN